MGLSQMTFIKPLLSYIIPSMPRRKVGDYIIDLDCCLGVGAFSQVYKATNCNTNRLVAVKVLNKIRLQAQERNLKQTFISQVKIMRMLKSDSIVELLDVVETQNQFYVVQEYCNNGDLRRLMDKQGSFSEAEVLNYLKDLLDGFITLIQNGVIHRDVKPENILINNGKMKIADFGFAKVVLWETQFNRTLVGTPLYMSPQILMSEKYTSKCDIWSIGILAYEMLFQKVPWGGSTSLELLNNIVKIPLKFGEKQVSVQFKDFIMGCLKIKEDERYSWNELLSHKLHGGAFESFAQRHNQEERRFKEVVNNLRVLVHSSDVDLQKIFQELQLNANSMLSKQTFRKILKRIGNTEDIIQDFDVVISKLDEDSDSLVAFEAFQQLLRTSNINTKRSKRKNQYHVQRQDTDSSVDLKTVIEITRRLTRRMKESGISSQQLYISYAKSKSSPINVAKFERLLLKIDKSLTKSEIQFCFETFDADKDGDVTFKDFEDSLQFYGQ